MVFDGDEVTVGNTASLKSLALAGENRPQSHRTIEYLSTRMGSMTAALCSVPRLSCIFFVCNVVGNVLFRPASP